MNPTICLNMIVKNESHIIEETLKMLCDKINFSYWVISDTGSTDDTPNIITNFFKSKNIKGELIHNLWKNFAHNRTLALEAAYNKSDLLFIFDADDEIHGDIQMPNAHIDIDGYLLNFGSEIGISYQRILLVNNRIRWNYQSVVHEYINCLKPNPKLATLEGNYYIVSGRRGNRSSDPDKYLKDAKILEEAYYEAKKNNDMLYLRYGFYCANSYKDSGKSHEAIKWYKITLENGNWEQEKYMSCYHLYNEYCKIGEEEKGIYYLVESVKYDSERMECIQLLIKHYCLKDMHKVAYQYYALNKDFYETQYLQSKSDGKLFLELDKPNFILPYYMILVCDKVKNVIPEANKTIVKMYEIIFIKKCPIFHPDFFIGNVLYNLQFFIEICLKYNNNFVSLFQSYINFLQSNNFDLNKYDFMKNFEKYGVKISLSPSIDLNNSIFTEEECKKSNKVLIYTGFSNSPWNHTYGINNALGGSETAVINLANQLSSVFEIFICGSVGEEIVENKNIRYINLDTIKSIAQTTPFHTIIVSRYISFYEMYPQISFYQSFIWGHDIILFNYGCNVETNTILKKWDKKIKGCICQTNWHKNLFSNYYPELKDKFYVINNGIEIDNFTYKQIKITNRFIYTSCSERGLDKLLELWPSIVEHLPDAELFICSYNHFPHNDYENKLNEIIKSYSNVKHLGKLNKEKLYELMSTAEYWLYPTNFNETSCITAMEMLMSEVICIYYPLAGLIDTLGDYGIPVKSGDEINTIVNLSMKQKQDIKKRGKSYALSCSWENRKNIWLTLINCNLNVYQNNEKINKIIKIVNLKRNEDRRQAMLRQLQRENIENYEFFEAVDGLELKETKELQELFNDNNFKNRKGIIGCTLSHMALWKQLINDENNNYYVILEDDIEICTNFKEKLNKHCELFCQNNVEHLSLGIADYNKNDQKKIATEDIKIFQKDVYEFWNITFAYIISKSAAKKIIDFVNSCSIKCALDDTRSYADILDHHHTTHCIAEQKTYFNSNTLISSSFNFDNTCFTNKTIQIAFCGGTFNIYNNFITNNLEKYSNCNISVVNPNENSDILFYSDLNETNYQNYNSKRKIFYSGEPFGISQDADFNITFDKTTKNNYRIPLWLLYTNQYLFEECERRKNGIINVPKRNKFCSFISNGEDKTTYRREIVEKLSAYKQVDCGGKYLNNIGYNVPRGINCSGKIDHNNNYKFAIAFENENYPGYVSEKICDIYKSNCIPIYWGNEAVMDDFNPNTFIYANKFENFDKLVEYIIQVDNDNELYASYFKEPFFSKKWLNMFKDPHQIFYRNLIDLIIGNNKNLYDNFVNSSK
jgi:GR25 family glycosyltransferase involved in LPS biosynthesis/glycosyltransferase involved in cell wall biosynthesis